jgi:hypothetical protein
MSKNKIILFFEIQFFFIAFCLLRCQTTSSVKFRHILKIHPVTYDVDIEVLEGPF